MHLYREPTRQAFFKLRLLASGIGQLDLYELAKSMISISKSP